MPGGTDAVQEEMSRGETCRSRAWLSVALAASLAACGGGSTPSPGPTPAPTPTPCSQTSLVQESGGIPGQTLVYDDFSVPDSGRLDVTMDWTYATSQLGFYLVPANTCTSTSSTRGAATS